MSDQKPVMDELVQLIRFTFGADDSVPVTRETVAFDIDGWDSLSHATLLIMVEKKFGIQITNEEGEGLEDVGMLADLIERKAGKAS